MFKLANGGRVFTWQGGLIVQVHDEDGGFVSAFRIDRYAYGTSVKDVLHAMRGWEADHPAGGATTPAVPCGPADDAFWAEVLVP